MNHAQAKFAKRLAAEIDSRGTMDVLRRGVEDLGVKIRLAFFKPAHALTPELGALYDANRLVVTRQVHHSESNPHDSLDILLLLNGLPIATAELKNQATGQTVDHAIAQYRGDRTAKDLIFDQRTVVHVAVDQDQVFLTTRQQDDDTYFLPFNQGSGGPGRPGGKGNPPNPAGYRTAYLWEEVWQRDNWLDLLARFVHEERPAGKAKKSRGKIIFPRYHQWDLVRRLTEHAATHGPGPELPAAALRRLRQVQQHRVAGPPPLHPAHPSRPAQHRKWARPEREGVPQGRRRDRPGGAGPPVAGHDLAVRPHPRCGGAGRQEQPAARRRPCPAARPRSSSQPCRSSP